jgi:hypothetical protein
MQNNDIVNKYYNSCGCIYISELNIMDNIIHDIYIQLCKTHYLLSKEKSKFKLDKKNKLYILNSKKTDNIKKKKISYDNLKLLINDKNKNDEDSNKLIKFGKYKNKTYEYVYNTDKLYCYHLAYWKDNNLNNSNITNFINYIKLQV